MKLRIMLLVFVVLMFTGCGSSKTIETLTCTFEGTETGYISDITAEVDEDYNIKNATVVMTYDDEQEAQRMCNLLKSTGDSQGNLKCNEKEIVIENFHKSMNGDDKITKEDFLKYMKTSKYTCKIKIH